MLITSQCPSCNTLLQVDDAGVSKDIRCPSCGEMLTVVPGTPPTAAPFQPAGGAPRARQSGLAMASLVCGILGFCTGVAGLAGLILGIVALVKAHRQPDVDRGKGYAIAGIVTGSVSFLTLCFYALMVAVMLPSLSSARQASERAMCETQVRSVVAALHLYAGQNDAFPPTLDLLVRTGSITRQQVACPSVDVQAGPDYRYVAGLKSDCDGRQIIVYETVANHGGEGAHVAYCDGLVRWVSADEWREILKGGGVGPAELTPAP